MTTRASLLRHAPSKYELATVELDEPRKDEILVKMAASGLCHSDDHLATGDLPAGVYPLAGGHEGAGVVVEVGPHTGSFEAGDHVVFSFLASCGRCEFCARGLGNLCDRGADVLMGARPGQPGSYRMSENGTAVGQAMGISTLSEYTTVSVDSAVKIDSTIPLEAAALLGCAVPTGWGSAVNSADITPGGVVIVMGVGGIGAVALQGAVHAGARTVIAVDPVAFKREVAPAFGATHAFATIEEATECAKSLTNGQGADATIVTVGVVKGDHIAQALASVRKAGTVVVTALGPFFDVGAPIMLSELTLYQKRIQGSLFGQANARFDIPQLLRMYQDGVLKLDELITRRYRLEEVAQAYEDMHAGTNIRGLVVFDD
ncbi:NDMA-dependent alcohol dehydrogenase [Dietzia cinnamea]|uniref:NDMA-dependent alcohol dehydrogenase n=1 Tax=Dietzia cinnamea TaxID=321318 RepID=UPI0021A39187|nr:NDMA-dependent alcohol dehydrogenase [Dietzia cinnamea]MCT2139256.1 NDMA-dependent alcohol dehydrogenase [Dietzia cinnamea]